MNKWTKKNTIELITCIVVSAVIEGTLSFCKAIREAKDKEQTEKAMDLTHEVMKDCFEAPKFEVKL